MLTMLIPQVHSQVETLLFKHKEHPVCNIIWRVGQLTTSLEWAWQFIWQFMIRIFAFKIQGNFE